jgi:hypothetical protein
MMLPVALFSLLAVPGPADGAPTELAAPAPAEAVAPVDLAPAPAEAVAPVVEPVAAEPVAPPPGALTRAPDPTWTEPAPAPVVVITPAPEPPLTLSPPAPTWGPVRPTPYVPPSEARVRQTMQQHRRAAVGAFVVGGLGMSAALGFQWMRASSLQRCAANGPDARSCSEYAAMDYAFSRYSALGMAMFVAGTAGAGAMLGNAAATRDVQLRHGNTRPRGGLKLLGIAAIGAASAWMIGANLRLVQHESQCGPHDAGCVLRYRPLRWAANDGAALGIAAGAGMLGYAIAYENQGKALMRLRAAPSVSTRHTGVAVSMAF